MDHRCTVVGFFGIDKYDIILYLSLILHQAGKKVLAADCSETGALSACIPKPKVPAGTITEYRGLFFMDCRRNMKPGSFKIPSLDNYDYFLADYGFQADDAAIRTLDRCIIVTDQQLHNAKNLSSINRGTDQGIGYSLIIRDCADSRQKPGHLVAEIGLDDLPGLKLYASYLDEPDTKCRISCQYNGVFSFTHISAQMKSIVISLLHDIAPELGRKESDKAYRKAMKGAR